jgi:hypothetical protein
MATAKKPEALDLGTTYGIEMVSPEQATRWLGDDINSRNRRMNPIRVQQLAGAMRRGEWKLNGDPIRFTPTGTLLDGQHRLSAIAESGQTVPVFVVRGIDADAQITMDRGTRRTLSHHLQLLGERQVNHLAATLNLAWQWDQGVRRTLGQGYERPSYEQAYAYLQDNPGIRDSVDEGTRVKDKRITTKTTGSVAHWILVRLDHDDTSAFFDRLCSGTAKVEDDPVFRLRETLRELHARGLDRPSLALPLTFKAWNAYRSGQPVKLLRYRAGGSQPEGFPEPK